jgi:uncharacterized membrane protein (DUF2068 family)
LGEIPLAMGIISLALVIGLWRLKPWAFWATIVLQAISVVVYLLELANPQTIVGLDVLYMVPSIVILLYFLIDVRVRDAFRIAIV